MMHLGTLLLFSSIYFIIATLIYAALKITLERPGGTIEFLPLILSSIFWPISIALASYWFIAEKYDQWKNPFPF